MGCVLLFFVVVDQVILCHDNAHPRTPNNTPNINPRIKGNNYPKELSDQIYEKK